MATIVNNPSSTDNGNGFLIGIVLLIAAIVLFLVLGLPRLSSGLGGTGTQVQTPGTVNLNVQHPK